VAPDFAALAGVFGLAHRRVEDGDGLRETLAAALHARDGAAAPMVEVRIDADASRTTHQAFWAEIAATPELAGV
jgi:2-succinyl-5-enolpyruvyl-6-hydroxy-3-cyclohexene-1-carboxylate synthase